MYADILTQRADEVKVKWHSVRLERVGSHFVGQVLAHLSPTRFLVAYQSKAVSSPSQARIAAEQAMAGLNAELATAR